MKGSMMLAILVSGAVASEPEEPGEYGYICMTDQPVIILTLVRHDQPTDWFLINSLPPRWRGKFDYRDWSQLIWSPQSQLDHLL